MTRQTTVAVTPGALIGSEVGLDDSYWISDVRDAMDDYPINKRESKTGNGTDGVFAATGLPYRVTAPKMNDAAGSVLVTVTGVTYTPISTGTPGALQVYVDYDSGYFYFSAAPANASTLLIAYQSVRWRDSQILTNLMAGIRAMFPKFGKVQSDWLDIPQVNTWEYDLPPWLKVPGSRIISVDIRDPDVPTEPYRPNFQWERCNGLNSIRIYNSQAYSPSGRIRIAGWGPYATLADLEPELYHLPVLYAAGMMLVKKEGNRIRDDRAAPQSGEGGSQPGLQQNLGSQYLNLFWAEVDRKPRTAGTNRIKLMPAYARRFR